MSAEAPHDGNSPCPRLYSPGVLVGYSLLAPLTVALLLLGINVYRLGRKSTGLLLVGLSGLATVALFAQTALGDGIPWGPGSAMLSALVVLKLDGAVYFQAVRKGAKPAKWWPPLLCLVALTVLAAILGRSAPSEMHTSAEGVTLPN